MTAPAVVYLDDLRDNGEPGSIPRCEATKPDGLEAGRAYRCIRTHGHAGAHAVFEPNGIAPWTDEEDPR